MDNVVRCSKLQIRKKVELLKVARDYSFLADDSEPPPPAKEPPPRNVSAPTSDGRSAQMLPKSKQQLSSNGSGGRNEQGMRQERKSVPPNGQMHSKAATHKSSASKPSVMSVDCKRQLGVNNGNGPGRPASASNGTRPSLPVGASNSIGPARPIGASSGMGPGRPVSSSNDIGPGRRYGPKAVPSKMPIAPAARNLPPTAQKAPPSKVHSSGSKQHLALKKGSQGHSKDKIMLQRPQISSKPQVNRPQPKQVSSHSHTASNVQRPRKKQHLSEDEKALMMIRNMFHRDRYPVYDDDDVSDMEANFEEIQREEKRSARIARKEDEEELRKIEEEESRERLRIGQQAKKRKLCEAF